MPGKFHHEELQRGKAVCDCLAGLHIVLCGAGAVGSNVAENLARMGATRMRLIDDDRVEEHNLSTQVYTESDVGLFKVEALRNRLFRAVGCEAEAVRKRLDATSARKLLKEAQLVIDGFDNTASRQAVQDAVRSAGTPCLHVGLADGYAEAVWDEQYRVPQDAGDDVCDYPMARTIVALAAAVAADLVVRFLDGQRQSWSITLGDFAVRPLEKTSQSNHG